MLDEWCFFNICLSVLYNAGEASCSGEQVVCLRQAVSILYVQEKAHRFGVQSVYYLLLIYLSIKFICSCALPVCRCIF